jgi:hypothetical protein
MSGLLRSNDLEREEGPAAKKYFYMPKMKYTLFHHHIRHGARCRHGVLSVWRSATIAGEPELGGAL